MPIFQFALFRADCPAGGRMRVCARTICMRLRSAEGTGCLPALEGASAGVVRIAVYTFGRYGNRKGGQTACAGLSHGGKSAIANSRWENMLESACRRTNRSFDSVFFSRSNQ